MEGQLIEMNKRSLLNGLRRSCFSGQTDLRTEMYDGIKRPTLIGLWRIDEKLDTVTEKIKSLLRGGL